MELTVPRKAELWEKRNEARICRWVGLEPSIASSMASSSSRISQLSTAGRALALKVLKEKRKSALWITCR